MHLVRLFKESLTAFWICMFVFFRFHAQSDSQVGEPMSKYVTFLNWFTAIKTLKVFTWASMNIFVF